MFLSGISVWNISVSLFYPMVDYVWLRFLSTVSYEVTIWITELLCKRRLGLHGYKQVHKDIWLKHLTSSNVLNHLPPNGSANTESVGLLLLFCPTCLFFSLHEENKTDARDRKADMWDSSSSALCRQSVSAPSAFRFLGILRWRQMFRMRGNRKEEVGLCGLGKKLLFSNGLTLSTN